MTALAQAFAAELSDDYRKLVLEFAESDSIDTEHARQVIAVSGKTFADFEADTALVAQRYQWSKDLAEGEKRKAARNKKQARSEGTLDRRDRIIRECEKKVAAAHDEYRRVTVEGTTEAQEIGDLLACRQKLSRSVEPELGEQIASLQSESCEISNAICKAKPRKKATPTAAEVKRFDERLDDWQRRKVTAYEQIEATDRKVATLEAEQLKPQRANLAGLVAPAIVEPAHDVNETIAALLHS